MKMFVDTEPRRSPPGDAQTVPGQGDRHAGTVSGAPIASGSGPAAPAAALPRAATLLVALVFAGWLIIALRTGLVVSRSDTLAMAPIVLITAMVGRLKLGVYASDSFVSLSVVGNLAAGMLFGVPGAVISSTVTYTCGWTSQYRPRTLLFNLGALSLSNGVAALTFAGIGQIIPADGAVSLVPGALAAGAMAYVCQSALLSLIVALSQRRSPRQVWEERFRWLLPHWMGLGLVALSVAVSYQVSGVIGLLAFVGPALLMRYAMKQYLDRTVRSVEELRERNAALQEANAEVAAMTGRLRETYAGTLEALVSALDARDQETQGHSARVSLFTRMLAKQMGVTEGSAEWYDIERGALLHDVGKIGVPDAILRKPGKLTEEEWVEMRRHPDIGYEMLKDIPFLAGAAEIVAVHHERWDGKGYPRGLAGEAIPLGARMFAVADTFDAMVTDRPYRRARSYAECLAEITRCAGTQFDPAVVEALHAIYPQWIALHQRCLQATTTRLNEVA